MQFGLDSIPPMSKIEQASLELVGLNADNLEIGGTWKLQLLSPEVDESWENATYNEIANAPVLDTIPEELPLRIWQRARPTFSSSSRTKSQNLSRGWMADCYPFASLDPARDRTISLPGTPVVAANLETRQPYA